MVDQNAVQARLIDAGLRAHPLWITPDWLLEMIGPVRADGEAWIASASAAGIGSLLLVTKQHDGLCIWPTAADSPRVDGDFLGDVCRHGAAAGIKVYAYYSMAIDDAQVARHPDWAFVDRDGEGCEAIGFRWACLNSPYGAFVLAQLEEIVSAYAVDAIWLDIFALGPRDRDCLCRWCRQRYAEVHGGDLAAIADRELLGRFKVECLEQHLADIQSLRDRYRPGIPIAFNGAGPGFRRHPEAGPASLRLYDRVDFLSDEGHDPRFESAMAKAMRAHHKPFEILTSGGIANEWAGWVTKPAGRLSLEGSVVGSHGGSFGLGVSVLPAGELPPGELAIVAEAADYLRKRAPWFGPQETAAEVSILIQPFRDTSAYEPPERPALGPRLPRDGAHHAPPVYDPEPIANGAWDALKEHHIPFDFVHERDLPDRSRVLFLQASARLSDAYCDMVREFVGAGGTVIAEGHATLLDERGARRSDFALADVFGLRFQGYTGAWDANYVAVTSPELRAGLPTYPLLVIGPTVSVDVVTAEVLARLVPPIGGEQSATHHTASLYNPPGGVSSTPTITSNRFGAGRAIYLAQGVGDHIRARRDVDPWSKRLLANVVDLAAGTRPLRTTAPPGVEVVLNRAPHGGLWLHLLNHYVADPAIGADAAPELAGIAIELSESRFGAIGRITAQPAGAELALDRSAAGWVRVTAPPFTAHQVLDIELQGAAA
jgi:hypothetical protein